MGKQVFTQEILRNIQEKNGIITLDLILDALQLGQKKPSRDAYQIGVTVRLLTTR